MLRGCRLASTNTAGVVVIDLAGWKVDHEVEIKMPDSGETTDNPPKAVVADPQQQRVFVGFWTGGFAVLDISASPVAQIEFERYQKTVHGDGPMPTRPLDAFPAQPGQLVFCGNGFPGELKAVALDCASLSTTEFSTKTDGRIYSTRAVYDNKNQQVFMVAQPYESFPGEPVESSFLARIPLGPTAPEVYEFKADGGSKFNNISIDAKGGAIYVIMDQPGLAYRLPTDAPLAELQKYETPFGLSDEWLFNICFPEGSDACFFVFQSKIVVAARN